MMMMMMIRPNIYIALNMLGIVVSALCKFSFLIFITIAHFTDEETERG